MFSKQIEFIDNFQTALNLQLQQTRGARFDSERLFGRKAII